MTDIKCETLQNMLTYGGSFAHYLAKAWQVADSGNDEKLTEAFPELLERFHPKNWSMNYVQQQNDDDVLRHG